MQVAREPNWCPYHQTVHVDLSWDHSGCQQHGHCLNPVQCPYFTQCPMHVDGKNMFLAWSYTKPVKNESWILMNESLEKSNCK